MKIPIKLKASELTSLISLIEKSIPEKCTDRMEAIISLQMIRLLQTLKQRAIKLERPSLTINVEPDMAMSFVEFFYDYPIDCYSHAGNVVTKMINNYDQQTAQYF